jgi:hypothetical protein
MPKEWGIREQREMEPFSGNTLLLGQYPVQSNRRIFKNLFPSYTLRVFNEKQRDEVFQKMKWAVQLFSKMSHYLQRTDLAYNVP